MKIGVVLVTFNRLAKLKDALKYYSEQIRKPDFIIIVNNNSNDGTTEYLERWKKNKENFGKYVLNLNKNIGGSGGFYEGLKYAMNIDCDWVWISDDDAYPKKDALYNLEKFIMKKTDEKIGAICSKVINDGKIDINHRRIYEKTFLRVKEKKIDREEYKKDFFYIDLFSYVGTAIKKEILNKVGLTIKDYFIFYDDTEHSYRISKDYKIVCVPNIEIIHDVDKLNKNKSIIDWKNYYGIRNKIDCLKRNFPSKYYKFEIIRYKRRMLKIKDKMEKQLIKDAIEDGKNEILGINSKYYPGWKH